MTVKFFAIQRKQQQQLRATEDPQNITLQIKKRTYEVFYREPPPPPSPTSFSKTYENRYFLSVYMICNLVLQSIKIGADITNQRNELTPANVQNVHVVNAR